VIHFRPVHLCSVDRDFQLLDDTTLPDDVPQTGRVDSIDVVESFERLVIISV
jgi:hypothetical protein